MLDLRRGLVLIGMSVVAFSLIQACSTPTSSERVKWTAFQKGAKDGVATFDQTTRVAIRVGDKVCLEPVGPFTLLTAKEWAAGIDWNTEAGTKFGLGGAAKGKDFEFDAGFDFDYRFAMLVQAQARGRFFESLGQAYQVESLMQLAHAAAFRYCEANINGALKDDEYRLAVGEVFRNISPLLVLAIAARNSSDVEGLGRALVQVLYSFEACVALAAKSTKTPEDAQRYCAGAAKGKSTPAAFNKSPSPELENLAEDLHRQVKVLKDKDVAGTRPLIDSLFQ